MKSYIAGKITDLDAADACEKFLAAENLLAAQGHEPLNPMKLVDQDPTREYEDLLVEALVIVLVMAEAVYMLSNWRDSKGARAEHAIAEIFNKPIFYEATALPFGNVPPELSKQF